MTLNDIKNIIAFNFDIIDDEIDASLYIELNEINPAFMNQIEVIKINTESITCKLTNFIRREAFFHPSRMRKFLDEVLYEGDVKDYLIQQLSKRPTLENRGADITDDGGEAVFYFIENLLYDYLIQTEVK
jgi:hypothetical protein